jgi:hypothetical protein
MMFRMFPFSRMMVHDRTSVVIAFAGERLDSGLPSSPHGLMFDQLHALSWMSLFFLVHFSCGNIQWLSWVLAGRLLRCVKQFTQLWLFDLLYNFIDRACTNAAEAKASYNAFILRSGSWRADREGLAGSVLSPGGCAI